MLWKRGYRCGDELQSCSSGSSAVPTLDRDEDGGVALCCGNSGDVGRYLLVTSRLLEARPAYI